MVLQERLLFEACPVISLNQPFALGDMAQSKQSVWLRGYYMWRGLTLSTRNTRLVVPTD
jgi:hypothetical protein